MSAAKVGPNGQTMTAAELVQATPCTASAGGIDSGTGRLRVSLGSKAILYAELCCQGAVSELYYQSRADAGRAHRLGPIRANLHTRDEKHRRCRLYPWLQVCGDHHGRVWARVMEEIRERGNVHERCGTVA